MPRPPVHPVACRLPRSERAQLYAHARAQGVSVSGLVKGLVRAYLAAQPALQPPVHIPVNGLRDSLSSPPLVRPYRMSRVPQSRVRVVGSGAAKGGLLSDC